MDDKRRPNIVIVTDYKLCKALSCEDKLKKVNGSGIIKKIWQQGADFKRAYNSTNSVIPSCVSMLTGRYPMSHRICKSTYKLPLAQKAYYYKDILDILKELSYKTICYGELSSHRDDFDSHVKLEKNMSEIIKAIDAFSEAPFFLWFNMADIKEENPEVSFEEKLESLYEYLREGEQLDNTHMIYIGNIMDSEEDLICCHGSLLWQGPFVKPYELTQQYVSIVDIFPTLCEILNYPIPEGVQGRSLWPLITGNEYPSREFEVAYVEECFESCCESKIPRRMIQKGELKLICDSNGNGWLYNLSENGSEEINYYDDPCMIDLKADMLREMSAAIMRSQDPLPYPHRRYRVKNHPRNYWFDDNFIMGKDPGVSTIEPFPCELMKIPPIKMEEI